MSITHALTPDEVAQRIRQYTEERTRPDREALELLIGWDWPDKHTALKVLLALKGMSRYAEDNRIAAEELDIAEAAGIGTVTMTHPEETLTTVRDAVSFLHQIGAIHVEGRTLDETFGERAARKMRERADEGAELGIPREPIGHGSIYEPRTHQLNPWSTWLPESGQSRIREIIFTAQPSLGGPLDGGPSSEPLSEDGSPWDGLASRPAAGCVADYRSLSLTSMLHPVWELCSTALGVGPCRTYHALLALGHHKLLELTDVLGTSKQNVNNWLKKLRTAGLVEKVSDARWQAVEVDLDDIARNMDDSHMTEDGRVHQRTVLERPTARAQVFERLRVNVAQANLTGPPSVRHERTSRSLDELFKLPLEDAAARMQLETLRHELAIARQRLELEAALRLDAEHAAGWSA